MKSRLSNQEIEKFHEQGLDAYKKIKERNLGLQRIFHLIEDKLIYEDIYRRQLVGEKFYIQLSYKIKGKLIEWAHSIDSIYHPVYFNVLKGEIKLFGIDVIFDVELSENEFKLLKEL